MPSSQQHNRLLHLVWDLGGEADYVHRFVAAYASRRFPPRLAERITMASNELLQNAFAYSSLGRPVIYELSVSGTDILVVTTNHAPPTRLAVLRQHLEHLEQDPERKYREELERSMSPRGRSGALGLARVRHEALMDIYLDVQGEQVRIAAFCRH